MADAVVGQARADTPEHGADAGHQLGHGEGLDDVVVGAGVQAADAVSLFAPGGEHDDRQVAGLIARAQAPADLHARHLGQHPVQQDQVRRLLVDHHQRQVPVAGDADAIAFLVEIVLEQGGQGILVLDHKNIGRHAASPSRFWRRASPFGRSVGNSSPVIS